MTWWRVWLVIRALGELARFDIHYAWRGFAAIERELKRHPVSATDRSDLEGLACDALALASSIYFKPVFCLQRSACAVRLLRDYGRNAKLVIGYRPVPFLSHAWVEIDGRVIRDSRAYQQQMQILHTI
jgi:hypothetical protein